MRTVSPTPVKLLSESWRIAGFALTYALMGVLMLTFLTTPSYLSLIWPSSGLALVVLWRGGYRFGLGIFLGTLIGLLVIPVSFGSMLAFACSNTLSATLSCAWLNRRTKSQQFSGDMRSGRDFMSLLEAACISASSNALLGTLIMVAGGMMNPTQNIVTILIQWWQSDLLGVMLIAPIILIWLRWPGLSGFRASKGLEGFLCIGIAYLFGARIFLGWHQEFFVPLNHPYWMFLFITWAATRTGRHSLSLLLLIVALQGLTSAVSGIGYFADDVMRSGLNNYWSYMMVLGSVGYALSTLVSQSRSHAHQMQREIQFSEDIIRSLPGAFFVLDEQGRLIRWNDFLQDGTGYSAKELAQKPVLELIHEEDRPVLAQQIEHALRGEEGRAEARIISKDGLTFPCQLNGRSTILEGQTVIVGTGETIARRKKAEAALRESELRYRQLFENINASVTIFDLSFTIVLVNECNARMLKRTPAQMVGETLHTLYPERAEFFEQRYRTLIASRQGGIFEDEFPLLDGLHCFSSYVHPMLDTEGNPIGLQVIAFDISDRKNAERELRRSEELLSLALESTGDDVWDWDIATDTIEHTERWQQIMGYAPDETVPNWQLIIHPDDLDLAMKCRKELFDPETKKSCFELRLKNKQGDWKWLYGCGSMVAFDENGNPLRAVGTLADITLRKLMEEDLRKNEQMWRFALEGAGDIVWVWDILNNSIVSSPHYKEMLGYTLEDELEPWENRVHPDDLTLSLDNARALKQGLLTSSIIELRVRCKDGSYKYMQIRSMVVEHDAEGHPSRVVGTNTDITQVKDHQQQLERIAHFDALTALPNRLLLAYRLQQALAQSQRRGQSIAVAYLDLDGFKTINDTHGHDIGDELLVRVSQRMKAALREGDTLARIGGDEFIAVLVDLDQAQDCKPVLERLLDAASTPVSSGNLLLRVSASVGVTLYPGDGQDADELIRHADHAMYQAKQSGKNRYHMFDAEHDAAVKLQHETIASICRGLEQDEFLLLYQPKVNMRTGEVLGVEALIRWQHPEHGLVPPYHFLPVIDGQAADIVLGEWVINAVLKQMKAWREAGLDISVSVNISAYHLQQDRFVSRLASLLAEHPEVDPTRLELEILESGAFDDITHVSGVMRSCQNMGLTASLDDFGTGYSSLSYLKRLPARYLKIDQSFVRDMLSDPENLAIIDGIIGLARAFRRDVIAEGVESVEHGEILLQLGCELAQGYGIAMPMPASQLPTWIQNWQPDERWVSWQGIELNRDGRAHAFAEVKHRLLLNNIDQLLAGNNGCSPLAPDDCACCQLSDWLNGEGAIRYGNHVEFMRTNQVHERMHRLINEFVTAHAAHQLEDARALQPEIHASHHELRTLLHRMTQRPISGL